MRLPGRQPTESPQVATEGDDRLNAVCMPLLRNSVALSTAGFVKSWRKVWPDESTPRKLEARDGSLRCRLPGAESIVASVTPAPVPGDQLADPAATSVLWPEATEDLVNHGAHAVLVARAQKDRVAACKALMQFTAAFIEATGALGVYVGPAAMVVRADTYVALAKEGRWLDLWLGMRCVPLGRGRLGLITTGMGRFGEMEIEIPVSQRPCELLRTQVRGIADYLITQRGTIEHGNTVGYSPGQRIRVEHAPSQLGTAGMVYLLKGV